jgi:hypothetical protein
MFDKFSITPCQTQKAPQLLDINWNRPIENCLNFSWISADSLFTNYILHAPNKRFSSVQVYTLTSSQTTDPIEEVLTLASNELGLPHKSCCKSVYIIKKDNDIFYQERC